MYDSVKAFAQITAKTLTKWLVIVIVGFVFSIICFFVALSNLRDANSDYSSGGHFGGIGPLMSMPIEQPAGFALLFGAPVFIVLYFLIANKIAIQTAIHLIWKNKAIDFIQPKIKALISRVSAKQPGWLSGATSGIMLKGQLLAANRNNKETSLLKRKVLNFGLKKIKLDDVDFNQKDLDVPEVISSKVVKLISETTQPSFLFFWILLIIHATLLIFCLT